MGEMADMALDQMSDVDEFGLDGFDKVSIDPDTHEVFPCSTAQPKTCRCCGKGGLRWGLIDGKWRLFDRDDIHRCPVRPL
jgi:hypothetical protein